jgi:hypothetical protein
MQAGISFAMSIKHLQYCTATQQKRILTATKNSEVAKQNKIVIACQ